MDDIFYLTSLNKKENKRPPGRPPKQKMENNKNQLKIDEMFYNQKHI